MKNNASEKTDNRAGIQSVEVAARLLEAMAAATGPLPLKDIAEAAGMPASKAHRYMVSLCRTGMMEKINSNGFYDFGPSALAIGLAALGRIDVVAIATGALRELSDQTGATSVLAVWGEHGPTVIRFEENAQPVRMNVRVGSTLSVTGAAIGQVFGAYLPLKLTEAHIDVEWGLTRAGVDITKLGGIFDSVRARRLNRNIGEYVAGVSALAAPVFDAQGTLVAVIGLLGHEASLDTSWTGDVATALDATVSDLSSRLGFQGDPS